MTKKLYGFCGVFVIVGACCAGSALAAGDSEQVTVDAPYTIRQQPMTRTMLGQMPERRVTVESSVSYADLDFSKQADVDTMRDRLRKAVRDNCRELDRRFARLADGSSTISTTSSSGSSSRADGPPPAVKTDAASALRRDACTRPAGCAGDGHEAPARHLERFIECSNRPLLGRPKPPKRWRPRGRATAGARGCVSSP